MAVRNLTQSTTLATTVTIADNPVSRMKGLLGRPNLPQGHALVIMPCNSVHMLFMQFAIDVVFLDNENKVVGLCEYLKPFQFSPIFWNSACAIELPAGTIKLTSTALGNYLQF